MAVSWPGAPSGVPLYVVLVGNARVGKSHLLNLLADEDLFESEISPVGVTTTVEAKSWKGVTLLNIPGLLEANPKLIARNKARLEEAMSKDGVYKVMFVFGLGNGGGIDSKDVAAYKEFCEGYGLANLPILLNNLDKDKLGGEGKVATYLQRTITALEELEIDAPLGLVCHGDDTTRARDQAFRASERFPWQRVTKKKEMHFDEKDKAVQEVMKTVEALTKQLNSLQATCEELRKRAERAEELAREPQVIYVERSGGFCSIS